MSIVAAAGCMHSCFRPPCVSSSPLICVNLVLLPLLPVTQAADQHRTHAALRWHPERASCGRHGRPRMPHSPMSSADLSAVLKLQTLVFLTRLPLSILKTLVRPKSFSESFGFLFAEHGQYWRDRRDGELRTEGVRHDLQCVLFAPFGLPRFLFGYWIRSPALEPCVRLKLVCDEVRCVLSCTVNGPVKDVQRFTISQGRKVVITNVMTVYEATAANIACVLIRVFP